MRGDYTGMLMNKPPHILLITADQMRADSMGCAGQPVLTPNLDRLAAEGTLFEQAFCVNPVCTPSRAAIFTGRYPHCTGAWNIGVSMNEEEVTLCDHLKPLGYRCVANGKMHLRPESAEHRPDGQYPGAADPAVAFRGRASDGTYFGFDETHITEDIRVGEYMDWLRATAPEWAARQKETDVSIAEGCDLPPELHQTHWIAEKSVETIRDHDPERPLFMWTSFVDPHHPFDAPRRYVDRYAGMTLPAPVLRAGEHAGRPEHLTYQGERGYWPGGAWLHDYSPEKMENIIRNTYAMVTFLDEGIGRILAELEAKGMLEETVILFTSDHGEFLGDHGLIMKGPWLYDALTRVPMILRGPGVPVGERRQALMENVDILPTLLESAGLPVPYGVQGRSVRPLLADPDAAIRQSALTSYDAHDRGIRIKSLRTDRWKLNVFAGEAYYELYDLETDPNELQNRMGDPELAGVEMGLRRDLLFRMMEDEDPLPERRCPW